MSLTWPWRWFRRRKGNRESSSIAAIAAPDLRAPQPAEAAERGAELLESNQVETEELGELAKLPPFRPVALSLLRLFDRPNVEVQEISNLVEADPATASELLAVVNSPLFAMQQTVTHASHAIALLGAERTKSLAAALAMRSLTAGGPRTPIVRRFWVHSIATATIAKHLAPVFRVQEEKSHITALLHDLGRTGLLAAYPDRYAQLACAAYENTAEILTAEFGEFGMTHCQAGALLSRAWKLPEAFQKVAAHHHNAKSATPLIALIQLSCRLADDFMYQAIHRCDTAKPEETVEKYAAAPLRAGLIEKLTAIPTSIDTAIRLLDF